MTRYVPTGQRAAGGIGSVLFCHDTNLDRRVAIKFVQSGVEHRRLIHELAALQSIRSKHVVEVLDVVQFGPDKRTGIVLEFIDGHDLTDVVGQTLSDEQFVRLVYQLSSGLADIHKVGVIHRDIKPPNVRIDVEGILKIIDFNLAREQDDAQTQGFVGTPGYAAPELYGFRNVAFTPAVDMYAFGVTAWVLRFGAQLPHELVARPPLPDAWKAHGGGFQSLAERIDRELVDLLSACVSHDPAVRPSAATVAERAGRVLLSGRHRALFVVQNQVNNLVLCAATPRARVHGSHGEVVVRYDGYDFKVESVRGDVRSNNTAVVPGSKLPRGCVIAIGPPSLPARERLFCTMDVSHPEVVL